jgi:hypothetical protein
VRSQVFFTTQVDHYGVARSPRLIEKSRIKRPKFTPSQYDYLRLYEPVEMGL